MKVMIIVIKDYEKPQEENAVKIFFEGVGAEVVIKTIEFSSPDKITNALLSESNSVDYMIGVGLAGFFVLSEINSNSRIVINPWMSPSQKISQKRTISNDLLRTLKKIETKTYDCVDAELRVVTYGIFTHDAGTCDKEMFLKTYGRNMNGVDNYSFMKENLCSELENTLKYFEYIASLNSWNYMPGPLLGLIDL